MARVKTALRHSRKGKKLLMDLIIRQACLRNRPGAWDIGIRGNRISAVAEHIEEKGATEVDAAGKLVAPTYVNGHIHLDKCHLQEKMLPNKDAAGSSTGG